MRTLCTAKNTPTVSKRLPSPMASGKPVVLDFYADWCASCKEMEHKTFSRPEVQAAVPPDRVFKIDLTDNTPEQRALLQEYGLPGPPGIFVIHPDGRRSSPLIGFTEPAAFIEWYRQQAS